MSQETAETDELGPWPKPGERWEPVLPWPRVECPAGLYVHHYSTVPIGGTCGWTWGVMGQAFINLKQHKEPVERDRAVMETWELRYGNADFMTAGQRLGSGYVDVDEVGAALAYVRTAHGTPIQIPIRDMRLGWQRVPPSDGDGDVEMPPDYTGQVVTAGGRTVYAWEKNGDLDPLLHPEQIGQMPPEDRCFDTPEECTAAAWADYRRTAS